MNPIDECVNVSRKLCLVEIDGFSQLLHYISSDKSNHFLGQIITRKSSSHLGSFRHEIFTVFENGIFILERIRGNHTRIEHIFVEFEISSKRSDFGVVFKECSIILAKG